MNPFDPSASFHGHFWDSGNYRQYVLVKIRMFLVFLSVLRLLVSLQGLQHQAEGTKTEFLWLSDWNWCECKLHEYEHPDKI